MPGRLASRDSQTTNHGSVPGVAGERARRRWGARQGSMGGIHQRSPSPSPLRTRATINSSSYYVGQQVGCRAPAGHAGDGKHREGPRAQTGNTQITRATCLEGGGPVQRKPPTGRPGSSHLRTRQPVRSADQRGFGSDHAHSPRVSEQNPSGKRLSAAEPGPAREDTALQGQGILWGHASL